MQPSELPSLHVALLDADTLEDLFRDLSLLSRVLEVRVKHHGNARAAPAPWGLDAARAALAAGQISGVQLRYELGSDVWCDTLLRTPDGTRLVRIREGAAPCSG